MCATGSDSWSLVAAMRIRAIHTSLGRPERVERGRVQRAIWIAAPIGAGLGLVLTVSPAIVQVIAMSLLGGFCTTLVLLFLWRTREPNRETRGGSSPL